MKKVPRWKNILSLELCSKAAKAAFTSEDTAQDCRRWAVGTLNLNANLAAKHANN